MTAAADEPHVGLVVEGRGEVEAVPLLLRTHLHSRGEYRDILGRPVPCHGREKALRAGGLEGFVATAAARPGCVGVLVILDSEGDPVCELGPELHARLGALARVPALVCLADPKYEAWLVASAETLQLGTITFDPQRDPVSLIKEALDVKYIKPTWQPRLTARVDLTLAIARSPSLRRALERLDVLAGGC